MSAIYPKFKSALNRGLVGDILSLNIKAVIIDTDVYTYNAAHEFTSDLSGVIATSPNLTGLTETNGVVDAANTTFTGVSGAPSEAVAYYIDTGVPATSRLISFIDGLTLAPDGGNVDLTINNLYNL